MSTVIEIKIITTAESLSPDILAAIAAIADSQGTKVAAAPAVASTLPKVQEQQQTPAPVAATTTAKEEKLSVEVLRAKVASLTTNNPNADANKKQVKALLTEKGVKSVSEAVEKLDAAELKDLYSKLEKL